MPSSNATLTFTTTTAPTYTLTTTIESGKTYIIVGFDGDNAYAMAEQKTKNRAGVGIIVDGTTATGNADVHEVVISAIGNDMYTIEDNGYLYAASSSDNLLKTEATLDDNGKWTIVIDNDGDAIITAQGSNSRNLMRFNPNTSNNNPLFACYATTSTTGSLPRLYVKDETPTYTLAISGYNNENVDWHLIASPVEVNPAIVTGMVVGSTDPNYQNFDLYYFDETGGTNQKEWKNYKNVQFNLVPGKGYLYAHNTDVDLIFTGTMATTLADVENLPYTDGNTIKSLYLAGNSLQQATTFYVYDGELAKKTVNFLTLNENGNGFETTSATSFEVPAMQGFFVQSGGAGWTLSTTDLYPTSGNTELLNIKVNHNHGTLVDNAIVSFSNAPLMNKFYLFDNTTSVYIPQDGEEMAVVNAEAQGEMPVNFRANENGQYTLTVNPENVEMNYLHLIDNMTGMDVDLLAEPSYTFSAKTTDYESRFKLVFFANTAIEDNSNETFAFFSDGQLIVNGEGTLQIFDALGRQLMCKQLSTLNCQLSTVNYSPGVYMLRLVNGENVKVQKVVVR